MPDKHSTPGKEPEENLRVGPWVDEETSVGHAPAAPEAGPAPSVPTPAISAPAISAPAIGTARPKSIGVARVPHKDTPGAVTGCPDWAEADTEKADWGNEQYAGDDPRRVDPTDEDSPYRTARDRLRKHGWLVAVGAAALIVLFGSRLLLPTPTPDWQAAPSGDMESSASVSPGAPTRSARPTPTKTAKPSPTPSPSKRATGAPASVPSSPRAPKSTAPPRKPTTPPRKPTAKPPAAPVLLGPDSDSALWSMLSRYCSGEYGHSYARLRYPPNRAENNWECRRSRNVPVLIDMNAACRRAYDDTAFASYTDPNNASSWRCYRR